DRAHGVALALRGVRHQRGDPAPRRDVVLEVHRGDQQGQGRADLQGRRLRDRRRSLRGAPPAHGGRQGPSGLARLTALRGGLMAVLAVLQSVLVAALTVVAFGFMARELGRRAALGATGPPGDETLTDAPAERVAKLVS